MNIKKIYFFFLYVVQPMRITSILLNVIMKYNRVTSTGALWTNTSKVLSL